MKRLSLYAVCSGILTSSVYGQTQTANRWTLCPDGAIEWKIDQRLPHGDHIEMSGEQVSLWLEYGVSADAAPSVRKTVVFPSFRMKPNDTHASLMHTFTDEDLPGFFLNGEPLRPRLLNGKQKPGLRETVSRIRFDGVLEISSRIRLAGARDEAVALRRTFFPAVRNAAAFERFVFVNGGTKPVEIGMEYKRVEIRPTTSVDGPHTLLEQTGPDGTGTIQPGDSAVYEVTYQAVRSGGHASPLIGMKEEQLRRNRVAAIRSGLEIQTPDSVLNAAFALAKLRVTESIFRTKNGYVSSPGGLAYYAAVWTNDQAEYAGPYFAYAGDTLAARAAITAYEWFAKYMNPAYQSIPSSIIAEGTDVWNGAGDRGDQAMIAYGAARFALAYGNRETAAKLWPLIEWCLTYCERHLNENGVVSSDSDELEGRFPAGKANLSTSCLYYDALLSAARLGKDLGKGPEQIRAFQEKAAKLRHAIESFFGADIAGFPTYRYYAGNTTLRSWICLPLTVGITDRKQGTIAALFSPGLWTPDGLATESGSTVFWDRSTLYALRGVFAAGETDKGLDYLTYYSNRRLLGEHVPYPVEAYPEGNQRHLATESALYCRIFTEGLFGLRPLGLRAFSIRPTLPARWKEMNLKKVTAFGETFDIRVSRQTSKTRVAIVRQGKKSLAYTWDGEKALEVDLSR